jgi:hypothetical protein
LKFTARQKDPAFAGEANDSNVRAQSHDAPFVAAARVLLAQADHVVETDFQHHWEHYSMEKRKC